MERRLNNNYPSSKMQTLFLHFFHENNSKEKLLHHYLLIMPEKEAVKLAYVNALRFIYFLKQGWAYFQTGQKSEIVVQPILLYYGMINFLKAIILLYDPHYPSCSSILQHGITTRKRKKVDYNFLEDYVKVQKDGLLPYFSALIDSPLATHLRLKVVDLLASIPDMHNQIFNDLPCSLKPVQIINQQAQQFSLQWEQKVLETENIKLENFASFLQEKKAAHHSLQAIQLSNQPEILTFTFNTKINFPENSLSPLLSDSRGNYYWDFQCNFTLSQEMITFVLVMFLLSMLCRYDTEQWGEIVFSFQTPHLPLIYEFISLALAKFPNLVLNHLYEQRFIFS